MPTACATVRPGSPRACGGRDRARWSLFTTGLPASTPATLVIAGALDPTGRARAEAIAEAIPDARLEIVGAAGHTPHLETPRIFRTLATEFLEEDQAA